MTKMTITTIEAYAKINLTLEVLGKRADGYHNLVSAVLPVSLSDTLSFEEADCISSDFGEGDLSVVAARALLPTGIGVRISTVKRIPSGGGLGGGSADAAATLVALNSMFRLGCTTEELVSLAASVGSDVPSLVLSRSCGPVLMEGRGEKVSPLLPGQSAARMHFVLANPGVSSSTAEVYANCVPRTAQSEKILYNTRLALSSGDAVLLSRSLLNDLEAPARALHPQIAQAAAAVAAVGARGVAMSGSGSTVFGVARDAEDAERMAAALAKQGLWSVAVSSVCPVM